MLLRRKVSKSNFARGVEAARLLALLVATFGDSNFRRKLKLLLVCFLCSWLPLQKVNNCCFCSLVFSINFVPLKPFRKLSLFIRNVLQQKKHTCCKDNVVSMEFSSWLMRNDSFSKENPQNLMWGSKRVKISTEFHTRTTRKTAKDKR